jgi:hypothetical protein
VALEASKNGLIRADESETTYEDDNLVLSLERKDGEETAEENN